VKEERCRWSSLFRSFGWLILADAGLERFPNPTNPPLLWGDRTVLVWDINEPPKTLEAPVLHWYFLTVCHTKSDERKNLVNTPLTRAKPPCWQLSWHRPRHLEFSWLFAALAAG